MNEIKNLFQSLSHANLNENSLGAFKNEFLYNLLDESEAYIAEFAVMAENSFQKRNTTEKT
jgi:hypothetical protein